MAKTHSTRVSRLPKNTKSKNYRFLTVLRNPEPFANIPQLCLTGLWLQDAGFINGSRVLVVTSPGRLEITINEGNDFDPR